MIVLLAAVLLAQPKPVPVPDQQKPAANEHGASVTLLSSRFTGDALSVLPAEGTVDCHIPDLCLAPGSYLLDLELAGRL